jgi:ribosome-associated protein
MAKAEKRKAGTSARRGKRLTGDIAKAVAAVLDLRHTPAFTDFFLVCSGQNQRQVHAIADAVEQTLKDARVRPSHIEGYDRADWVLMDYFTFIVHIFTPQTREFYSLERLWGDARKIDVSADGDGG